MNKLAIVGSGPNTRDLAPFGNSDYDIWVFNEAPMSDWCKRWDACFQMHTPDIYTGHNTKQAGYWEWLQRTHGDRVIYMQNADSRVPNSRQFPLDQVLQLSPYRFFGMSVCYALALAVLRGYEHIEVFGIELSFTEYQFGAESWRFWVGYAIGKLGADHVILRAGGHLFHSLLYGYEGAFALGSQYFSDKVRLYDAEWKSAERNLENIKRQIERLTSRQEFEKVAEIVRTYQDAALDAGKLAGAIAEAERYAAFGDRTADRNGFEFAAAKSQKDGDELRVQMYATGGMVQYVWNVWRQIRTASAANQLLGLISKLGKDAYDCGAQLGMFDENQQYLRKFDEMARANGGLK